MLPIGYINLVAEVFIIFCAAAATLAMMPLP